MEGVLNVGPALQFSPVQPVATRQEYAPDTKHDLEALALSRGQDVLGRIAVGSRVSTNNGRAGVALDRIEIELVVLLCLASTRGLLRTECEARGTLGGGNDGRAGRKGGSSNSGETHGGVRIEENL